MKILLGSGGIRTPERRKMYLHLMNENFDKCKKVIFIPYAGNDYDEYTNNVREMEGALTRIVAYASLLDTEVTLSIASNVIKDMVGIKQEKPLTIAHIQNNVSDYFNISTSDICSKMRTKEVAYARQIAMYIARELTNNSLPKIGEKFGNRDHTTVMHACDKIKQLLQTDSETKNIITVLIANIKNTP